MPEVGQSTAVKPRFVAPAGAGTESMLQKLWCQRRASAPKPTTVQADEPGQETPLKTPSCPATVAGSEPRCQPLLVIWSATGTGVSSRGSGPVTKMLPTARQLCAAQQDVST